MHDGLKSSGLPLGGLGTGSVELRADGCFHEWQIMNNRPWGSGPEIELGLDTSYFGLQVHGEDVNRSAVLGLAPGLNAYLNNPYDLAWLERPARIDADVRMPFTMLAYDLGSFPVAVTLEAFSPFIPLDAKNSALPLAFLAFRLENQSAHPLKVSLLNATRNLVGYTQPDQLSEMSFAKDGRTSYILFGREGLAQDDPARGSLAVGAFGEVETSYVLHPISYRDVWEPMRASGRLENCDNGDFDGRLAFCVDEEPGIRIGLPFGVLCQTCTLAPGESRQITFVLAWHFPEMQEREFEPKGEKGRTIGHRYENWFSDAVEVLAYGIENCQALRSETRAFFDAFYASSFDDWLLEAISAQLTTLIKSSWWDREGRFGIWEGLGCCGLQTTDITHYGSFPIVLFFPGLQKSQMRLTRDNAERKGKIPHSMPGTFSCCDHDDRKRVDLVPQFILQIWRDLLWTADEAYGAEMWPVVKDALAFHKVYDTNGDGLPNNTGPDSTYDQFPLKGTSALVGFLYAATLKAVTDLATFAGEQEYAASMEEKLGDALVKLDERLWNGRYYRLCHDPVDGTDNEGVMTDQINGDWFVRQTTGQGLLPEDKIRLALSEILERCAMETGFIANCAWPFGGDVEIGRYTIDQARTPWSGVEYALAAHLILAGMERKGLKVVRDVWDRYEEAGLRFNHIECGEHYYRAMSAWGVYLALTGFALNALEKRLTLAVRDETATFVLNTPNCWGAVETSPSENILTLNVRRGELVVQEIMLRNLALDEIAVTVDGEAVESLARQEGDGTHVLLEEPVDLAAGACFRVLAQA